jgi:hypothetical protein
VRADAAVQRRPNLRIPPLQVGNQHVAREIVRKEPVRAVLDERQPPQPLEPCVNVLLVQRGAQHRLGGGSRLGTHLQGVPVPDGRQLVHEPLQEGLNDVRCAHPLEHGRGVALAKDVDREGECQRVAVGDVDEVPVQPRRNAHRAQVTGRLTGVQVGQCDHPHQVAPSGVGAPGRRWRLPAGDDHQDPIRKAGQEFVAQPPVDRGQRLVGVDKQNRSPGRAQHAGRITGHAGRITGHAGRIRHVQRLRQR